MTDKKQADLTQVRGALGELVQRLRHAGITISDRRAVKLQRAIAASAILCGRLAAQISDLWVLRYIWDTEEQMEVLESLVDDALRRGEAAKETEVHSRSRGDSGPDPETIARDLERMAGRIDSAGLPQYELSFLRDQLGVLSGRCAWVQDEQQRTFLEARVSELWSKIGGQT